MIDLLTGIMSINIKQIIMIAFGGFLIFLAVKKDYEPALLLPIGFSTILVNIPLSAAIDQIVNGKVQHGALSLLFNAGILTEMFLLLILALVSNRQYIDQSQLCALPGYLLFRCQQG